MQIKAIKDQKESKYVLKGLPKLSISTDILSWIDKGDKHLHKPSGQDFTPLAYLIRKNAAILVKTDDLLPEKCLSATHKSLVGELVARKSCFNSCGEADKVVLFDYLDKALAHDPYKSTLQAFEDSKDGQAVIKTIILQHGGVTKWGKRTRE